MMAAPIELDLADLSYPFRVDFTFSTRPFGRQLTWRFHGRCNEEEVNKWLVRHLWAKRRPGDPLELEMVGGSLPVLDFRPLNVVRGWYTGDSPADGMGYFEHAYSEALHEAYRICDRECAKWNAAQKAQFEAHERAKSAEEARTRAIEEARRAEEAERQRQMDAQWRRELAEMDAQRERDEAAERAFKKLLAGPIPLVKSPAGIVFGTDIFSRETVTVRVSELPHLLVAGTSGFGKSVFLHQLVSQLVDSQEVDQLYLVDLKGGVEFSLYKGRHVSVQIVWHFNGVVKVVEELVALMERRLDDMRERGVRTFRGPRAFFIVDEYAQIELWPVETKEEKATRTRLLANLNKLSMLGRAAGVVLLIAVQKATADVMDSSFRNNLQGQVCFRVSSKLTAAAMFGSTEDLELDPMALPRGRCIFYDPTVGRTRYLQVHVAPEVELPGGGGGASTAA